jgi:oxaloacetate decarboxylase gamma subunit
MEQTLIQQGLDLMIYGVSVVFTFLIILVCVTKLMSGFLTRFFPEVEQETSVTVAAPRGSQVIDPKVIKIIQKAIDQHRGLS